MNGLTRAGAELQVIDLARAFAERGNSVLLLSILEPEQDLVEHTFHDNISVVSIASRKRGLGIAEALKIRRELTRFRAEVVHSHLFHANILSRLATALLRDVPLINTIHSPNEGGRLRYCIYRATEPLVSVVTHVSEPSLLKHQLTRATSSKRQLIVPNGIDLSRFRRSHLPKAKVHTWIAVGRLVEAKDHLTLLRALADLPSRSRLQIAGDGPLKPQLQAEATALGLTDRVEFLGRVEDVHQLLLGADAFVLSSQWEAGPIALIEAAAMGLPCVSTSVGIAPELFSEPLEQFVVQPGDIRALRDAMQRLEQLCPADRQHLGRHLSARVQHFDLDRIAARWLTLYSEVIASHPVDVA